MQANIKGIRSKDNSTMKTSALPNTPFLSSHHHLLPTTAHLEVPWRAGPLTNPPRIPRLTYLQREKVMTMTAVGSPEHLLDDDILSRVPKGGLS